MGMTLENVISGILTVLLATVAAGLSISLVLMVWEDIKSNKKNGEQSGNTKISN